MPPLSPRTPKTLTQWEELDYVRRRRLFRQSWRWAKWLGLLLPLAAVGVLLWPSNHRSFQAGPLSPAHALFGEDCRACHTESFQTLHRFLKHDSTIRAVSDQACSTCHAGPPHHGSPSESAHCASCHREHRGHALLARVDDSQCLSCHRNLKHQQPGARYQDVASWSAHPEFVQRWEGGPKDPGTLRFNHQKHLVKEGVFVLDTEQLKKLWEDETARSRPHNPPRKVLHCADCHQPDEAGRFMKPIHYEQHCKECHPLSVQVAGKLQPEAARTAWEGFNRVPAPHVTPTAVRADLRNRLTEFIQQHAKDFLSAAAEAEPSRLLPGRRSAVGVSREQFEWVNQQLPNVERVLFQTGGGCRYCHTPQEPARPAPGELPRFALSQINTRRFPPPDSLAKSGFASAQWFPHSRFRHDSHRMLDCQQCHKAATSTLTSEVLMPTLADCRRCHDDRHSAAARATCVTCHTYHPAEEKRAFRGERALPSP